MSRSRGLGLLLCPIIAVLGASSPARAWTRTVVQSAQATVELDRDASMDVLLRLSVEVQAGWLHELELAGLGGNVELDRRRPPYLRSDEGEIYRPEAQVSEDGTIRLTFARKDAPRRGEYRAFLRYRTKADVQPLGGKADEERALISWTLPAWETGLHNVTVDIRAPRGTTVPAELHDTPPGIDLQITKRDDRTRVQWKRIHLPRLTPWALPFEVPLAELTIAVAPATSPAPSGFRPLNLGEDRSVPWPLFLLAGLILLKRRSLEIRAGRARLLLPVSWAAVLAATISLLALGVCVAPHDIACALPLMLLALHRPANPEAPALERAWRPSSPTALSASKSPASDLLDGTTGSGLLLLVLGSIGMTALGQPVAALLLLPVFFTGTRQHLLPTADEATAVLRTFMSNLRLTSDAPPMAFRWEVSEEGRTRAALHLARRRSGLLSMSFVVTGRQLGFVFRRNVMLFVETRAQSDADDLVRRRAGASPGVRSQDGRIGRLVEWTPETLMLLRALANPARAKPVKASNGTWLLREITEAQREAA